MLHFGSWVASFATPHSKQRDRERRDELVSKFQDDWNDKLDTVEDVNAAKQQRNLPADIKTTPSSTISHEAAG